MVNVISYPLSGLTCQQGSIQTCANKLAGPGPSRPVPIPFHVARGQMSPYLEVTYRLINSPARYSTSCAGSTILVQGN